MTSTNTNLESKMREYSRRILLSRLRILSKYGFYGLMLMHVKFAVNDTTNTAFTDGKSIIFSPRFLDELNDDELDFLLMHEIMHIALKHCFRGTNDNVDRLKFNVACDIVVNSNILETFGGDVSKITLRKFGEAMHLAPGGIEGRNFTVEELYKMIDLDFVKSLFPTDDCDNKDKSKAGKGGKSDKGDKSDDSSNTNDEYDMFDDHSHWIETGNSDELRDEWEQRLIDANEVMVERQKNGGIGTLPLGVERLVKELKEGKVDWRQILDDFLSFEVNDYSFTPPDKRIDGPFFMPDFNDMDEVIDANILFMVDTSGSITDKDLVKAYSEIQSAIELGNGRLKGYVGFFDTDIYGPYAFDSFTDILTIKPVGGGGTDISPLFNNLEKYVKKMNGDVPSCIVVITDGYLDFPKESMSHDIPVLWIINNSNVTPPWGKVARIIDKDNKTNK